MFSVFLSSYRNTRVSWGELEKAVETLAYGSCSHSISCSTKLPLVFLFPFRNLGPELGDGPLDSKYSVVDYCAKDVSSFLLLSI